VITSRRNPLIQSLRLLTRSSARKTGQCVVEGWRLLRAVVDAGARVRTVLYTSSAARDRDWEPVRRALRAAGAQEVTVSQEVLNALTQVETSQGVLAIVDRPGPASPSVLRDRRGLFAVLDGIQDPGNVGGIVRTAAAAGATAVVTAGPVADPYSPKALRASAGAVFRLPLLEFPTAAAAAAAMRAEGVRVLVADPRGESEHAQVSFARPLALVFGSEGGGADPTWERAGAGRVRLPMVPGVESLNVAAAAAVLLYRAAEA
jgi:RNA methyltransferase, TrmH family